MSQITITVSGRVGSGKSALCGEIEILCKALGIEVEWGAGQEEKNLTHADWIESIEMYKPSVRIVEVIEPTAPSLPQGIVRHPLATKEWCMKMAALEPEEGVPPAGLAALDNSTAAIPVSPEELAKLSTAPSLTTDAGAVLTDERAENIWYEYMGHSIASGRMVGRAKEFAQAIFSIGINANDEIRLTDVQKAVIKEALEAMERDWRVIDGEFGPCGKSFEQCVSDDEFPEYSDLRALLAAHPTEQRMSDAARDAISEFEASLRERANGFRARGKTIFSGTLLAEELDRHADTIAARKAEIERSGGDA